MGEYLLGIDIGTSACKILQSLQKTEPSRQPETVIIRFITHILDGQNRIRKNGGKQFAMQSQGCS